MNNKNQKTNATKNVVTKKTTTKKAVAKKTSKAATKKAVVKKETNKALKKPIEKKAVKTSGGTKSFKTQDNNSISSGKIFLNELGQNLETTKENIKNKGKEIGVTLKHVGENAKEQVEYIAGDLVDSANKNYKKALNYTKNNPKRVAGILAALVGVAAIISSKKGKGLAKGIIGAIATEQIIKKIK